jgi:hypothetical protein
MAITCPDVLLAASHHRAYDEHLWLIKLGTHEIETSPKGPSIKGMKFERTDVARLQENDRCHI